MSQYACSECKPPRMLSRCRVPGTITWAWRCPIHGILHEVAAKGAPRALEVPDGIVLPNRAMRRDRSKPEPEGKENVQHGGAQKPHARKRSSKGQS